MKAKPRSAAPVTVHALLAALALVAAYFTWTRDRTQVQSEWVVVLDLNKRDISSLVFEDETRNVKLERRDSDGDPYSWVTVQTRIKQAATPPAPSAAPVPSPAAGPSTPPGAKPVSPASGAAPAGAPAAKPAPAGAPAAKPAPAPAQIPAKGGDKAAGDKDKPAPAPASSAAAAKPAAAPAAAAPKPAASAAAAPPAASVPATTTAAPAAAPVSTPPAAASAPELKESVVTKEFRGNEQADKLIEMFAPMRVVRALGTVDDKKAKELGLENSKKSLTIFVKGQPTKFVVGTNSYGTGDVYARDPQGQVYLLSHRMISDFEFAESRLLERRLHRFERADFDRVEVQVTTPAGVKTRTLLQKNRQDSANFFFTDAASPDKRDDSLRNWVDKILRIAMNDYVNKGEEPQAAAPASGSPTIGDIVTVRYFDGKKKVGEATFSRYPNKTGQTEYFVRTETTLGLVRLLTPTVESAIQDAEKW